MIKSFVINLDRNPDRLNAFSAQFSALDLPYERFPAVDGKQISDAALKAFADARPKARLLGPWTKGKMGCQSSHRNLWELALNMDDECIAIFEDDLVISQDIKDFLRSTDWIPTDADIVRLEGAMMMKCLVDKVPACIVNGRGVHRLLPNKYKNAFAVGTGAYILTNQGAKKIMAAPLEWFSYTDRSLFCHVTADLAKELVTYQVSPAVAIQGRFVDEGNPVFASEIETTEHKDFYQNPNVIKRYLRKYGSKIGLFQLFSLWRQFLYKIGGYAYIYYKK